VADAPIIVAAHPSDTFGDGTADLLADLAGGARVVCVNPQPGRFADMVDEIDAVRRRLGIDRWVFWGISGGGWLALLHARRHPEATAGVIIDGCCACFRRRLADPACLASPFHPAWRERLAGAAGAHDDPGAAAEAMWTEVPGIGAVLQRGAQPLFVAPFAIPDAMRRALPEMWAFDAAPWLPELRVPALVIAGTADPIAPLAHVRAVHEALAGSTFVAVDGAGHVPTTERRPEVAAAVRRVLAS